MRDRNIYAYTAPGADLPEYLSINRRDDRIFVTVRSPGAAGTAASMILPEAELDKLIYALRGARINPLVGS